MPKMNDKIIQANKSNIDQNKINYDQSSLELKENTIIKLEIILQENQFL